MCGIAGIISQHSNEVSLPILKGMAKSLAHRGPDGEGFFISPSGIAGLAHRRLAIIDLTDAAAQPMHYAGRYSMVYNGELYNYTELRRELIKAGYKFSSQSDTEVILAAYEYYQEKCLQYFDGMFALAIWDEQTQTLFAARDRFGEKPFYFFKDKKSFLFGSEMKALWIAGVPKTVDQKMLINYLCLGHVHNPENKMQTFFEKVYSLPRAHYLILDAKSNNFTLHSYWNIDKQLQINISENRAIEKLDELLKTSVTRRLRSDVQTGTSLSGGLDSSAILSYIKDHPGAGKPIQTFSAVFPGFEKDESTFINLLSKQWNIKNHPISPTALQLANDFSRLCHYQEEPFPSSSIYAQYKVYETASQHHVPVLLDGQGADEIFAGYHKYIHWYLQEVINRNRFSKFNRERKNFSQNNISYNWGLKNYIAAWLPSHVSIALEKKEFNKIIHNPDLNKDFLHAINGREWEGIHKPVVTKLNDILYFNTMQNGLEELLRYADRNSMAHSVEVRLPFLFADLVKFVFSLPSHLKINQGFTKYILRKTLEKRLPEEITWRTDKIGFEPPQKLWTEHPAMQEMINDSKHYLIKEHILKPQALNKKHIAHHAHDNNNFNWRYLSAAEFLRQRAPANP